MTEEFDERKALQDLLDRGFKVQVWHPYATNFSEKYYVYSDFGENGKKSVIVDDQGKVRALQG